MEKHKYNIFPEMSPEEYQKLLSDLEANGFDNSQPIVVYENAILDGWNRFKACEQIGIGYAVRDFSGSQTEAINFVMRTNKRRNLTSQQWAAIAADAEDLILFLSAATETERRQKQAESLAETHASGRFGVSDKLLSDTLETKELTYELDEHANKTATKLADNFNTNRTYINQAKKLKKDAPEKFEAVKEGKTTFQEIERTAETEEQAADMSNIQSVAQYHSDKITRKIRELSASITAAKSSFRANGLNLSDHAPRLVKWKSQTFEAQAKQLAKIKGDK